MHELSIALSLLDRVEEEAARQEGRVSAIYVRLGPLSGVVPEALVSAYELAREGTVLEGTQLRIEETPVTGYCSACAREQPLVGMELVCPVCGAPVGEVVGGRELDLVALEIVS
jgi:hydrogenase nickel incorporation protein HypA/HybF